MIESVIRPLRRFIEPSLLIQVLIVGSMTVGVKAIAFLKELAVAHRFGTSDEIDAFLIAFLIPTLLAFVAGDAFRDAVLPAYAERKVRTRRGATNLVSNVIWICGGVLFAVSLISVLLGSWLIDLIAGNFSPEKAARCEELLRLVFPFGIAFGLSRVLQGYLQANGKFALSSLAPAVIPAVTIAALLVFPEIQTAGILAVSVSLGALLLVFLLLVAIRKTTAGPMLRRPGWDAQTRSVVRHAIPLLAGTIVMEGCYFIDTMMAASLPAGSVAVLNYGERICNIVLSIGGTAAGFVLFPHVSELAAKKKWKDLSQVVFRFSTLTLAVSLPFIGFFWILSEPIVRLLLERGEFTGADTVRVADVLRFASFQIPGYILAVLAARVAMALRANHFVLFTTVCVLGINVGLNLLFIRWFGVKGIALSTAVVTVCSATMLFSYTAVRIRRLAAEG